MGKNKKKQNKTNQEPNDGAAEDQQQENQTLDQVAQSQSEEIQDSKIQISDEEIKQEVDEQVQEQQFQEEQESQTIAEGEPVNDQQEKQEVQEDAQITPQIVEKEQIDLAMQLIQNNYEHIERFDQESKNDQKVFKGVRNGLINIVRVTQNLSKDIMTQLTSLQELRISKDEWILSFEVLKAAEVSRPVDLFSQVEQSTSMQLQLVDLLRQLINQSVKIAVDSINFLNFVFQTTDIKENHKLALDLTRVATDGETTSDQDLNHHYTQVLVNLLQTDSQLSSAKNLDDLQKSLEEKLIQEKELKIKQAAQSAEDKDNVQTYLQIDMDGFKGVELWEQQQAMAVELMPFEQRLAEVTDGEQSQMNSILQQIKKVVVKYQNRCCFLIADRQQSERYKHLSEGALDRYQEAVEQTISTFEWACMDLRAKATEVLMLEAYFQTEQLEYKNEIFEDSSSSMVPFAESQVIQTFKSDTEFYEQVEMKLSKKECESMVRFSKTQQVNFLMDMGDNESSLLAKGIKLEDELQYVFGIESKQQFARAIIEYNLHDQFQL